MLRNRIKILLHEKKGVLTSCSCSSARVVISSAFRSGSSSLLLFKAKLWSMSKELYMGDTNNFSVEAKRSHFGVHMCRVIHVWDSSHSSHIQAYCKHKIFISEIALSFYTIEIIISNRWYMVMRLTTLVLIHLYRSHKCLSQKCKHTLLYNVCTIT